MTETRGRYRVIRELSSTLYGWVFVCEGMGNFAPAATSISSVVVKLVSLERMANFTLNNPLNNRLPDHPIAENVGELVRSAGGHPKLVQYQDSFVEHQTLYLVIEHCTVYDPKRADIWSLGIVFFVLLTGSPLVSLASRSVKPFRALKRSGVIPVLRAWGMEVSVPTNALPFLSGMPESIHGSV